MLDQLKIENRENLLEFLVAYSRFEYALKRTNYLQNSTGTALPNWFKFISEHKDKFDSNRSEKVKEAAKYLLEYPAKQQNVKNNQLCFETHTSTQSGSELLRLFNCLRITRNNLFHGGKFPHIHEPDLSRNQQLIEYCIVILKEFLTLNPEVNNFFWEVE